MDGSWVAYWIPRNGCALEMFYLKVAVIDELYLYI